LGRQADAGKTTVIQTVFASPVVSRSAPLSIVFCFAAAALCGVTAVLGDAGVWRVIAIVACLLFVTLTCIGVLGLTRHRRNEN